MEKCRHLAKARIGDGPWGCDDCGERSITVNAPIPKAEFGKKHDQGKPPMATGLLHMFPRALMAVAQASAHGAEKYGNENWKNVERSRFSDSLIRHFAKEAIEYIDSDSGLPHEVLTAWNGLVRLEKSLLEKEMENGKF